MQQHGNKYFARNSPPPPPPPQTLGVGSIVKIQLFQKHGRVVYQI